MVSINRTIQRNQVMDPKTWNERVQILKDFFEGRELPERVKLYPWCVVTDPKKFVAMNLKIIEGKEGCDTFWPYMKRLRDLMKLLEPEVK